MKVKFIPLEEALKYGHSEEILNTKFELNLQNRPNIKYCWHELEYTKRTGKYPSFPLEGWGNKKYIEGNNLITNYPKMQPPTNNPIDIESRPNHIMNGRKVR